MNIFKLGYLTVCWFVLNSAFMEARHYKLDLIMNAN